MSPALDFDPASTDGEDLPFIAACVGSRFNVQCTPCCGGCQ